MVPTRERGNDRFVAFRSLQQPPTEGSSLRRPTMKGFFHTRRTSGFPDA